MAPNFDFSNERFLLPQSQVEFAEQSTSGLFRNALSETVDYPSLDNVVFPGDSVAFVLLDELPGLSLLTESLLEGLPGLLNGCSVSVVSLKSELLDEAVRKKWEQVYAEAGLQLSLDVHDPDDKDLAAYIAVNIDGDPLYVNRVLFECDVVVPIRRQACGDQLATAIFPLFSNLENRSRFTDLSPEKQRAEVRLIRESLGINFVVDIATNPGGNVVDIIAGNCETIEANNETNRGSAWDIEQVVEGKTVIVTIESSDQTWTQFFDALVNASVLSLDNEQIIVRTEIDQLPGAVERAILHLQFEMDQDSIATILKDVPERYHGIPGILEDKSVFVKCNLDENAVEELGVGCIENDNQIQKFIDNAESGVFLRDAHLCRIVDFKTI